MFKGRDEVIIMVFFLIVTNTFFIHGQESIRYFDWQVTSGEIGPLGVPQKGILINGRFPGPDIYCVTNDTLVVNVHNGLDDPFLISWNGLHQKDNSWEDGVFGTNCPIPRGKNFTYVMQVNQVGTFFYFPSMYFHKALGGFGGIRVLSSSNDSTITPSGGEYVLLIGDWYTTAYEVLKANLDRGVDLGSPDGILINGRSSNHSTKLIAEYGKTYRFRISNVGIATSLNFRIEGHTLTLIEVEGTNTVHKTYTSLDVHLGQSYSVLVTANQPPKNYYIIVSTRFTGQQILTTTGVLHYDKSQSLLSGVIPEGPTNEIEWSIQQARSMRLDSSASGLEGNYLEDINITRTILIANSGSKIGGKQTYGVNGVSFLQPNTPLKLADYFNVSGVYQVGTIPDGPRRGRLQFNTSVMEADYGSYLEIVFQNNEDTVQSWHMDGYSFFVVGMANGKWKPAERNNYNLVDAISRCTTQVYPKAWTAIYMSIDNIGMWNVRSENWSRQYLGQQFYLRVSVASSNSTSLGELPIPRNVLLCGQVAVGQQDSHSQPPQ